MICVQVIYRPYFMYALMGVFPLVTGFIFLCNVVELPLDKLKFVKLSGASIRGSFQRSTSLLSLLLFLSAVAGLCHFPTGGLWLLPPLGPMLCWPCDTFSQTQTAHGACLKHLEPAGCSDAAGNPLSQGDIRSRLSLLWSAQQTLDASIAPNISAPQAVAAAENWLAKNNHLFQSRRCGCSPCTLILTCACDEPPEQRFPSSPLAYGANNSTAIQMLPRYNYSLAGWENQLSAAGGGESKRGWCGNPIAQECWTCPESSVLDFPDPIRTLARWRVAPFCWRCLHSQCICGGEGGTPSCPLNYQTEWQIVE